MKKERLAPALLFFLLFLVTSAFTQNLPDTIRGYKVHQDKITLNEKGGDALVNIGEPNFIEASLTGLTFELAAEIQALEQSGKVDFLAFHDFKVNGISVEPEEYTHNFQFRKGENVKLPKPARVFIPTRGLVKAAWKQVHESKTDWNVTGRIFVFGRFRRLGLYHKRVIPIDIDITIKNPLNSNTIK
jgi:hypothetical protein